METSWTDSASMAYHQQQWDEVKESTKFFLNFIKDKKKSKIIVDIGCGLGAATTYIAGAFPMTQFVGIDYSPQLIKIANEKIKKINSKYRNVRFQKGDVFELEPIPNVDGVISLQTMSWLSEIETPLREIFIKLNPNWVCISSLFYEGAITARTEIFEHQKNRKVFYNTYSLPILNTFSKKFNYEISRWENFYMPFSLSKPVDPNLMGTYTRHISDDYGSENIQISGPILMNWKVVMFERF